MCAGLVVDGAEVRTDDARACTLSVKRARRWAMRRDTSFWKTLMLTEVAKGCGNRAAVEGARKAMPTSLEVVVTLGAFLSCSAPVDIDLV
jgi:hypothetical protein